MTEIEKLYENVGIKKRLQCNTTMSVCTMLCERCQDFYNALPPFTAEKQIKILKLLTQQCDLTISHFRKWEFLHFDGRESTQVTGKDFVETFAKLINAYWQSLTEKEKDKIRGILNE